MTFENIVTKFSPLAMMFSKGRLLLLHQNASSGGKMLTYTTVEIFFVIKQLFLGQWSETGDRERPGP